MSASVESARRQWAEGHRRLQAEARDRVRHARLLEQVDVVSAELRRRLGQTFTLAQLAEVYERAESWSRSAIEEAAPYPGWARTVSLVEDAAFHLYSRGASDWRP